MAWQARPTASVIAFLENSKPPLVRWIQPALRIMPGGWNTAFMLPSAVSMTLDALNGLGIDGVNQFEHLVGMAAWKSGKALLADVRVDADGRRPFHPGDVGERYGFRLF